MSSVCVFVCDASGPHICNAATLLRDPTWPGKKAGYLAGTNRPGLSGTPNRGGPRRTAAPISAEDFAARARAPPPSPSRPPAASSRAPASTAESSFVAHLPHSVDFVRIRAFVSSLRPLVGAPRIRLAPAPARASPGPRRRARRRRGARSSTASPCTARRRNMPNAAASATCGRAPGWPRAAAS